MSIEKKHNLPYTPEWLANKIDSWIARKQIKDTNRYSVTRNNIYILPSKSGWLFLSSLIAILAGAINYNNSLAYLLCFFLTSLGFTAMLLTHSNLKNLTIFAKYSPATFPGQTIHFNYIIRSDNASNHIALQTEQNIFSVNQHADTDLTITEKAGARGQQHPSRFKLFTEFPLGLFHAWTQVQIENPVIVYPKPVKHDLISSDNTEASRQKKQQYGDDEFSGIRDFIKGDNPKSLAWKTIARTNQLYTKEFHTESGDSFIFDLDHLSHINNIEERLSILCSLILQASQDQLNYGLKLPGKTINPANSDTHRHQCLSALALYNP